MKLLIISTFLQFILWIFILGFRKFVNKEGISSFLIHIDHRGLTLFGKGVLWGLLSFFVYVAIACIMGSGRLVYSSIFSFQTIIYIPLMFIHMLFVALFEESFSRGYILIKLKNRFSSRTGIIINSIIFGSLHFFSYSRSLGWVLGIINATIVGILLSIIVIKTNSLMMAVGYHFAWNGIQSILMKNFINIDTIINLEIKEGIFTGATRVPETGFIITIILLTTIFYLLKKYRNYENDFVVSKTFELDVYNLEKNN